MYYEHEGDFDEFLDESYPLIQFGDVTYTISEVFKVFDPVAYATEYFKFVKTHHLDEVD